MAAALAFAAGTAGLQALAIREQNKAIGEQLVSNVNRIKDSLDIQTGQLEELAASNNRDIALEMSANRFNGLKNTASTVSGTVERNIAGNTATRQYNDSIIKTTMSHNALEKKAEDNMASFGVEMENARLKANEAIFSATATAASQYTTGLEAITQITGAGLQGYSMGSAFGGSGGAGGASVAETSKGSSFNQYNGTIRK